MPLTIHIHADARYAAHLSESLIRKTARAALRHQNAVASGALTIRITGDALLRKLNREFMGKDYATDVLSFPVGETEAARRYFGDVVISIPRARAQAKAGGHTLTAELQLLIVHGVLHLLGHDHATRKEKAAMWAAQAEILTVLKAPLTAPVLLNEAA
ncbi:MAG: rRNA maturation RNase YbeY [Anaerolineales bacterium]|nr:rRNA maturation RNase YbeY [Anaerolineales bacterium]